MIQTENASARLLTPEESYILSRARVFSTGMIARLVGCAPRTVSKWIDAGRLKGYLLPITKDRRVPRDNLLRFLRESGMPTAPLDGQGTVVALGVSDPWANAFTHALGIALTVERHDTLMGGAIRIAELYPSAVVLDGTLGTTACAEAAGVMRRRVPDVVLLAVLADDAPASEADHYDLAVRASDNPALAAAKLLGKVAS
jgi:hypothetical protein